MSVTMERPQAAWQTHPGWGIAADLTPREVVAARQVRVNQRLIVLALLLVVGLCVSVSLLAKADQASAERAYEQEQARTAELVASSAEYDVITTMQTVIAQIKGQLTTAMTDDVDLVNLMARLRTSVPTGLEISNEAVLLTPPVAAGAVTDPATGATTTTGGAQVIGTITISGTGARVRDVTPFVAKLNQLRGIVDVVPTSVNQTDAGMAFTLSMNLTDLLYTHRYDATADPAAGGAADSSTATDPEVAPVNNTSNRPWVIGGIVVALAMVAATWLLVVGPTRSTTSSLDDDTAAVQLQNAALVAKTNALAGQDRDQLVADVTAALGSLPPDAALPDFNRELTRHAKDRGVELASISVGAAAAPGEAGSTTATPGLVAVPVTIQTRGPALAQLFFLRDIQEVGPRAALVTTTSLAAQDDASIELNSTLTTQLTVFTASLSTSDLTALAAVVDPEVLGDAADPNASALPTDDTATD